ncbi:MAG: ribosome recycling factor [Anaerolineae bacterium]|nr:ribosome recycling factor [Anaerolineae bacterium]
MIKDILADAEERMKATVHVLEEDLKGIRTGRASTALVEKLMVEYYGAPTSLIQLATASVPDAQTIMIRPFDRTTLHAIERAILQSDIGLTPNNDGEVIRLNIPPLDNERRKELVKQVHKRLEECKVAVRNIRRSAMQDIHEAEKEKLVSEDEMKDGEDKTQKLTDKYVAEVDEVGKRKEKEIMDF